MGSKVSSDMLFEGAERLQDIQFYSKLSDGNCFKPIDKILQSSKINYAIYNFAIIQLYLNMLSTFSSEEKKTSIYF